MMGGRVCRLLVLLVLVLSWLVGVGAPEASAAPPVSSFAWGACPEGVTAEVASQVRCGVLTVPESRTSDSSRTIALPVAVVPSRSATPAADPLVFPTTGGPGGGSLSGLWYWLDYAEWARAERDIIVVEQRGDHLATPDLDCPEVGIARRIQDGTIPARRPGELDAEAYQQCYDRLTADGVDLSSYNSAATAADLADLRQALGFDQWNLYGASYGTRVSLTTMRDQPAGLRAVVLDGVYPPNGVQHRNAAGFAAAVREMFAECAEQPSCAARYPDLENSLMRVLDRVRTTPLLAEVRVPDVNGPVRMEIGEIEVLRGLLDALYSDDTTRALPFLIDQLDQGNDEVAVPLAQQSVNTADYYTEGLWRSIDCAEELPFYPPETPSADPLAVRYATLNPEPPWCSAWPVVALGEVEDQPVVSNIPTLLMSGGHDPVTPPWQARRAAETLSRHYLFEFGSSGHTTVWQTWISPCPADIASQFVTDPTREPDAACMAAMTPGSFVTTDDIHPTSAVYRANNDVFQRRDPTPIALVVSCVAVFLLGVIAGVVVFIRRRGPRTYAVAMITASALSLGYSGAMFAVLRSTDPLILGFGIPTATYPLLLTGGILTATATLAMAGMAGHAWARRHGTVAIRIILTIVAAASMLFTGWLLARGLLFW